MAMSYMTREDIPYHYALADAFTVGDAYYCSVMGPTNPNRCYMWTRLHRQRPTILARSQRRHRRPRRRAGDQQRPLINGVPCLGDAPGVLQAAGVSWKIYQDIAGDW